jgi:hypothetical protein
MNRRRIIYVRFDGTRPNTVQKVLKGGATSEKESII